MKPNKKGMLSYALGMTMALLLTAPAILFGQDFESPGRWIVGDFHQHTTYTDGSTSFNFVMMKNNQFGLDWWANSEHGGGRVTDGFGHYWDDPKYYPVNPILGDLSKSGGHQVMWRWQSVRDYTFPQVLSTRSLYPEKRIISGLEWNVPGHEHCSTAIVAKDASAISAFEYQFDKVDLDKSRNGEVTPYGTLAKKNVTHNDAVAACGWMQNQYYAGTIDNGWIIFAHIERAGTWKSSVTGTGGTGYNIENFRDFNNAGPDVCFGFEGAPGHQAGSVRGEFSTSAVGGGTYGGVGIYTAKVGGLWDAMLGEGRRWFNFASSDYHSHWSNGGADFYPGEYQKNWTYANYSYNPWKPEMPKLMLGDIGDALRSGNSYFAMGDLINHLEFTARSGWEQVPMGGELLEQRGRGVDLTIRFGSPLVNNNDGTPRVDHIDLIAGDITGTVDPMSPDYTKATNENTKVIASFTNANWVKDPDGNYTIIYRIDNLTKNKYFRLRGTNLGCGVPNETSPAAALPSQDHCNPLVDTLVGDNTPQKAFDDLWFYSNPIFVYVR